jgi:hypothetical protein
LGPVGLVIGKQYSSFCCCCCCFFILLVLFLLFIACFILFIFIFHFIHFLKGGTTGATFGGMVGSSLGKMQREVVDKELFERHLKEKWVSDLTVTTCMLCGVDFTSIIRKHHCRSCGGIFCW